MSRIDSADSIKAEDIKLLKDAREVVVNMEAEAVFSLKHMVEDKDFVRSIERRVSLLYELCDHVQGSFASLIALAIKTNWGDSGAAIDDYTAGDGSSEMLSRVIMSIEDGRHDEDYAKYGWDE